MLFSQPYFFILVPIILSIWYVFFREKIGYIIPNILVLKHLYTPISLYFLWLLRSILIFFLVGILAGPYRTHLEQITEKASSNILIILDISRSMLAEDIQPNRLAAAKKTIGNFIRERKNDNIGLIIFAGKPILAIPFSSDYSGIVSFLGNITPEFIQQEKEGLSGTNIGDALLLGNMTLSGTTERGSIIFVTDGRANIGIDPRISLEETIQKSIPIYTVGISGSPGSELFYTDSTTGKKLYFYDEKGNILKNDIDETLLEEMASKTKGKYFRAGNTEELGQYLDNINSMTYVPDSVRIESRTTRYNVFFLIGAIFIFLIETAYRRHLWKKYHLL